VSKVRFRYLSVRIDVKIDTAYQTLTIYGDKANLGDRTQAYSLW